MSFDQYEAVGSRWRGVFSVIAERITLVFSDPSGQGLLLPQPASAAPSARPAIHAFGPPPHARC